MAEQRLRLNVWALALAGGLMWALCVLFIGLSAQFLKWGVDVRALIGSLYVGFDEGVVGILIGVVWAFPDAFILLLLFGALYNALVGKPKTDA